MRTHERRTGYWDAVGSQGYGRDDLRGDSGYSDPDDDNCSSQTIVVVNPEAVLNRSQTGVFLPIHLFDELIRTRFKAASAHHLGWSDCPRRGS